MNLAVEFRGLSKSFQGIPANVDLHLKVRKGSIHAIIGENGAGKSTAMKILYGTLQPDAGDVFIQGQLWGEKAKPWSSPSDAIHAGIGMVHQHFMLGTPYSALDNILLGLEESSSRWGWLPRSLRPVDRKEVRKKLEALSTQYGMHVDWDTPVEDLSVGVQQRIEILKLLYRDADILILDEPTAVLTPQETQELFANLKKLCQLGKTVLIITHKLKEVMDLADRVTVFRAGRVVGEREIADTQVEELACLMVGRKVNLQAEAPVSTQVGDAVLEVKGLSFEAHCRLRELNFKIQGGEVVGICGVEGNGQSELLEALLHPKEHASRLKGEMRILGTPTQDLAADEIRSLGVGIVPDDRHRDALLLDRSVQENFLLGLQRRKPFSKKGWISTPDLEKATWNAIEEYDIRPKSAQVHSRGLSGGNQQKLVIARELQYSPRFLIAAQPTRGVDVGAIEFIHKKILELRSQGAGVLLISSELDEILALSDRILVMYGGRIVAEFKRGEATEKTLGLRMGGAVG